MGFFSWTCPACDHSIRHAHACRPESQWLSNAVVLLEGGGQVFGTYSGYGEVSGVDVRDNPEMWHRACWELYGKPSYCKASEPAQDQGHFVGEYDPSEPKTMAGIERLRANMVAKREAEQEEARVWRMTRIAEYQANGEPVPSWLLV